MKEIVLRSGRFAAVQKPKWGDLVMSYDKNALMMVANLAARIVTLDGQKLSVEDYLNMDAEEFSAISTLLCKEIEAAFRFKDGIA